jgi:hypothetical protein
MKNQPTPLDLRLSASDTTVLDEVESLFWSGKTRQVGEVIERLDLNSLDGSRATRILVIDGMSLFQLGDEI